MLTVTRKDLFCDLPHRLRPLRSSASSNRAREMCRSLYRTTSCACDLSHADELRLQGQIPFSPCIWGSIQQSGA